MSRGVIVSAAVARTAVMLYDHLGIVTPPWCHLW